MVQVQQAGAVAHVNLVTPVPGNLEEFIALQLRGLPRFGTIPGWQGTTLYRARNGRSAVILSLWDDEAAHGRFVTTDAFLAHREKLRSIVAHSAGSFYDLVYRRAPAAP